MNVSEIRIYFRSDIWKFSPDCIFKPLCKYNLKKFSTVIICVNPCFLELLNCYSFLMSEKIMSVCALVCAAVDTKNEWWICLLSANHNDVLFSAILQSLKLITVDLHFMSSKVKQVEVFVDN